MKKRTECSEKINDVKDPIMTANHVGEFKQKKGGWKGPGMYCVAYDHRKNNTDEK